MSGWMSWFGGRKDSGEQTRGAIVELRQQLLIIDKREQHLQTKIEEEMKKARANVTTNKRGE
jgi:charged multivesicular body protein 4